MCQKLGKASQIYSHGAGCLPALCFQLPVGPAVLVCVIAQCRQEAFSPGSGFLRDRRLARDSSSCDAQALSGCTE